MFLKKGDLTLKNLLSYTGSQCLFFTRTKFYWPQKDSLKDIEKLIWFTFKWNYRQMACLLSFWDVNKISHTETGIPTKDCLWQDGFSLIRLQLNIPVMFEKGSGAYTERPNHSDQKTVDQLYCGDLIWLLIRWFEQPSSLLYNSSVVPL